MDGGSVVEAPTQSRVGRAVETKVSHWRTGTFGPASEEPYRRRTIDWIRLVTAAVLLYLIARHANDLTRTERDVFQFFNGLPGGMKSFFRTLYRFGALWAVGLVVVAALVARRWRLASLLYGACLLACLAAFGASISFWTLLAANIGVSTIASLIPIPGGGTAVSAVGLSGLLVAAGVPDSAAVAAILANQLVVSFIPAVPGWFATRDMFKRGYV